MREDEKARREQAPSAQVVPGGHEVPGRSIPQMVSFRLEAQVLQDLRQLADTYGVTLSVVLRQSAEELLERSRTAPVRITWKPSIIQQPLPTTLSLTPRAQTWSA